MRRYFLIGPEAENPMDLPGSIETGSIGLYERCSYRPAVDVGA